MSGQGVEASPEEIERFASELEQFTGVLAESLARLNGQFARLGETWRDQEHQRFAEDFQETVRVLHHFMRASEDEPRFLRAKAQWLRGYQGQR